MAKYRFKLGAFILLSLLGGAVTLAIIFGTAQLISHFQQGADPAASLNIVPNVPVDFQNNVVWLPDDADTGRKMEPLTRQLIEENYRRAWLQWHLSHIKGAPLGLETYFVEPAQTAVANNILHHQQQNSQVRQTDTDHHLQLHFYSADGSIVAFTDRHMTLAHHITQPDGTVSYAGESIQDYQVIMMLEDGYWRVHHWLAQPPTDIPPPPLPNSPTNPITVCGPQLCQQDTPFSVAGINYYAQEHNWDAFWLSYDPAIIEADLTRIRQLDLNTVRIFVQFETFGGADVDPDMLVHLTHFLDTATAKELKVIVTLFDFRTDYQLLLWPSADRHLQTILTEFASHEAILAWDIKNEPDLDYAEQGKERVDAWLAHTLTQARRYAPHHLLTIGWAEASNAPTLAEQVDFVSFHYYAPASELGQEIEALETAVSPRPILLTEFGLPTWNSYFFPNGHTEAEQARYYADILHTSREHTIAGTLAWTLYDYPQVPTEVGGRWPWQKEPQKHLGIIDNHGQAKPAAALLNPQANLSQAPNPPSWYRWFKPFWLTVYTTLLTGGYIAFRWHKKNK